MLFRRALSCSGLRPRQWPAGQSTWTSSGVADLVVYVHAPDMQVNVMSYVQHLPFMFATPCFRQYAKAHIRWKTCMVRDLYTRAAYFLCALAHRSSWLHSKIIWALLDWMWREMFSILRSVCLQINNFSFLLDELMRYTSKTHRQIKRSPFWLEIGVVSTSRDPRMAVLHFYHFIGLNLFRTYNLFIRPSDHVMSGLIKLCCKCAVPKMSMSVI